MPRHDTGPVTIVAVELSADLSRTLGGGLARALEAVVQGLLDTLGIPSRAEIALSTLDGPLPRGRFLRLSVGGRRCRYSDDLLRWTLSYHAQRFGDASDAPSDVLDRVLGRGDHAPGLDEPTRVAFLTSVCLEAIKEAPAILLGPEEAAAYTAALPMSAKESHLRPAPTWLAPVLQQLLNLRASLANNRAVADVLAASDRPPRLTDIVEQLFEKLRTETVEILLSPLAQRDMMARPPQEMEELFSGLREGLATDLGMTYPPFHIALAEDLQGRSFAFRLGALRAPPWLGLAPGDILVNDSPGRLAGLQPRPALVPGQGYPAAILQVAQRKNVEALGNTTWNPQEHLRLAFALALKAHGRIFISRREATEAMDEAGARSPLLGEVLAKSRLGKADVARVLRALAAEQIHVGDRVRILERLAERADPATWPSAAAALPDYQELVAFVRAGFKRELCHKFGRQTETVVVYLLDATIENFATQALRWGVVDADIDRVVDAIAEELQHLPPMALVPALLTRRRMRSKIREVIARELPRLDVISYDDLPPDTNIQPVARIVLSDV